MRMIKLSIPFTKDNILLSLVKDNHIEYIEEIFMPIPNDILASARPFFEEESEQYKSILEDQVKLAKSKGIKVTLIANKQFIPHEKLRSTSAKVYNYLKDIKDKYDIDKVIISNLYILRQYGEHIREMGIEIELSVLVGINSVDAFEQIINTTPSISSVCLGDNFIHDVDAIRYIKKTYPHIQLKIIPNHGCFVNCASEQQHHNYSACTFSSNNWDPIAHSNNSELMLVNSLCATCRSEYGFDRTLKDVSFIRPEDTYLYDGLIDLFKVSGREHDAKEVIGIIEAYGKCSYDGSLANLLDMNIGVRDDVLNNNLPSDIGVRRSTCNHKCYKCHYCESIGNFEKSHTTSTNIEV